MHSLDALLGLRHEAVHLTFTFQQTEREERDTVCVFRGRRTPRRLFGRLSEKLALTDEFAVEVVDVVVVADVLHELGQECHDLGHRRFAEDPREAGLQHFGSDVRAQAHGFVPVGHIGLVDHPEHLRCQLPVREEGHVGGVLTELGEVFKEVHRPSSTVSGGIATVLNI